MTIAQRGNGTRRPLVIAVLGVAAFVAVGVWGIANLLAGDWFIGTLFTACALVSLVSLASTIRRLRREGRSGRPGPSDHL